MKKQDSTFISKGVECSGSLYTPDNTANPAVIILCHGLATERTFGLKAFVDHFLQSGLAVFTFDYRCFGDSKGTPRNYIDANRHIQDIEAAIQHVKTLSGINNLKIGLWGSSYGGGHVLMAAANSSDVKAVAAQVPFVSGIATVLSFSFKYQMQGFFHGFLDIIKTLLFLNPHYVKVIALPDEFALMNTPESNPGYAALIPKNSKWENKAPAKICLTLPAYMPTLSVSKIKCPALIIYAKNDSLIPYKAVEKAISKIKNAESLQLNCGHFDIYSGPLFEQTAKRETEFFIKNLK
jgi:alpha-beta hydrolase superfamily lysophospholipase